MSDVRTKLPGLSAGSQWCLLALFLLVPFHAFTQAGADTSGLVRYTPEFEFREGIFLNFEQVRNNDPIPKSRILTNLDFNDRDFFTNVLNSKELLYYDHFGMKQKIRTNDVWGFSRNGVLYIALEREFHRVTIIGQICHFVANVTTYNNPRYYDPYYYNPYDYYYRYGGYPLNTKSNEMRQYLLDFETGNVYDYDYRSLEILIMKDPGLHDEYTKLRKKKKRQLKFVYLRKFNERNPLFFPAY